MTIICSKCGVFKSEDSFHRYADHPTGRRPDCKQCRSEVQRRWAAVEDNLQLLFATDNIAKKNRLIEPNGGGLSR